MVNEESFDPSMANVSGVSCPRHTRRTVSLDRTTISTRKELPLFKSEVSKLIHTNKEELTPLILVHVILIPAVSEIDI